MIFLGYLICVFFQAAFIVMQTLLASLKLHFTNSAEQKQFECHKGIPEYPKNVTKSTSPRSSQHLVPTLRTSLRASLLHLGSSPQVLENMILDVRSPFYTRYNSVCESIEIVKVLDHQSSDVVRMVLKPMDVDLLSLVPKTPYGVTDNDVVMGGQRYISSVFSRISTVSTVAVELIMYRYWRKEENGTFVMCYGPYDEDAKDIVPDSTPKDGTGTSITSRSLVRGRILGGGFVLAPKLDKPVYDDRSLGTEYLITQTIQIDPNFNPFKIPNLDCFNQVEPWNAISQNLIDGVRRQWLLAYGEFFLQQIRGLRAVAEEGMN